MMHGPPATGFGIFHGAKAILQLVLPPVPEGRIRKTVRQQELGSARNRSNPHLARLSATF